MNVTPPRVKDVDIEVAAPPSKSYTHRALIIGALGKGTTTILNPLYAEDTKITLNALRTLGITITEMPDRIIVAGCDGTFLNPENTTLDLDNSGTSLRLLASLALLCRYPVILTGSARMQERPIGPLVQALFCLGGLVKYLKNDGYPPVYAGGHLRGGPVTVDGTISSQFISSVLIASPYADREVEVVIPSLPASRSYLDITLDIIRAFGAEVTPDGYERFLVGNQKKYAGRTYAVEGDYSSAAYFFALAAVCGGRVLVQNLEPHSVQGDRQFLDALGRMGCAVTYGKKSVTVERSGDLQGITFDMSSSPDSVQTLCMVAAIAKTPTTITGIGHLKYKESDRITSTAERLKSLGGNVKVEDDRITVYPASLHGGSIDPDNDHRTAMSFAVLGLSIGGITIRNAECVSKSFPEFWDLLAEAVK
jgi:3-phosphoshikimate 1-carboxyvinyltransferase